MIETLTRERPAFHWKLLLLWLLVSTALLAIAWPSIIAGNLPDPDDHMRLQQVRDLLNGQSWFDTRQYRMNPPAGAPMHWSRLVDIPLLLLLAPLGALFGSATAEMITMNAVPLLTLGWAMWLIALLARCFLGDGWALLAALLLPCLTLVWIQFQPLRIDHHGWQLVLALSAVTALLVSQERRSGLLAGGSAAIWLSISIEGLPIAATIGSLLALRWAIRGCDSERLLAYLWSLATLSALTHFVTAAAASWQDAHCDALTYPYLLAFTAAATGMTIATRLAPQRHSRFAALALVGALALCALGLAEPTCLNGPFAELDPVVRRFWYVRVPEGLPIWEQSPTVATMVIGYPLVGLAGACWGWTKAAEQDRRDWSTLIYLLTGAIAVALVLQRGGGFANALAVPGALYALRRSLPAARAIRNSALRLIATVAVILLLSPWALPVLALNFEHRLTSAERAQEMQARAAVKCSSRDNLAKLNHLPPANLLTPLDIAPSILTATHHRLVASGHHRNQDAMRDTILAFTESPEHALRIFEERRIDYLLVCPYQNEPRLYSGLAPAGLWSRLRRGETPNWLEPVQLGNLETLQVWRVRR